jgi:hypothetical protein
VFAIIVVVLGVLVWSGQPPRDEHLVFRALAPDPEVKPRIWVRYGVIANAARDYPASFYATYVKMCSGTLIGRNTILMSAHCLSDYTEVEVVGSLGRWKADCERHERFVSPPDFDVALCHVPGPGSPPLAREFEQIARAPFELKAGDEITVSGWGVSEGWLDRWWAQVRLNAGVGGAFRLGRATVRESGHVIYALGAMTSQGRVTLDHGDSGGAVYVGDVKSRRIVGTNSCGGEACGSPERDVIAVASLIDGPTIDFIEKWASRTGAHVCGREPSDDAGCRQ